MLIHFTLSTPWSRYYYYYTLNWQVRLRDRYLSELHIFTELVRLDSERGLWRKSACTGSRVPLRWTVGLEAGFLTSWNLGFLIHKSSTIITDTHHEDYNGRGSINCRERQDGASWGPHYYSSLFLCMLSLTDVEVTKFLIHNQITKIKSRFGEYQFLMQSELQGKNPHRP